VLITRFRCYDNGSYRDSPLWRLIVLFQLVKRPGNESQDAQSFTQTHLLVKIREIWTMTAWNINARRLVIRRREQEDKCSVPCLLQRVDS
jgi:hypothetical protein